MTDGITEARKGMEQDRKMKVFLGGTCNNAEWRDVLIPKLRIDYFNPVVEDWTPDCQVEELKQREECDFLLYVLTPRMQGVYSIAEVVDDSNKRPGRTIFCFLEKENSKVIYIQINIIYIKDLNAISDITTLFF